MRYRIAIATLAALWITPPLQARDEPVMCGPFIARWNRIKDVATDDERRRFLNGIRAGCSELRRQVRSTVTEPDARAAPAAVRTGAGGPVVARPRPKTKPQPRRSGDERAGSNGGDRPRPARARAPDPAVPFISREDPVIFDNDRFTFKLAYLWIKDDGATLSAWGEFIAKTTGLAIYTTPRDGGAKVTLKGRACSTGREQLLFGSAYNVEVQPDTLKGLAPIPIGVAQSVAVTATCDERPQVGDTARVTIDLPVFDGTATQVYSLQSNGIKVGGQKDDD